MANASFSSFGGCPAIVDGTYEHRIFDAMGPGLVKFVDEFVNLPKLAAGGCAAYLTTLQGAGTTVLAPDGVTYGLGGRLVMTTSALDDDSIEMQALGSCFLPISLANRLYFGIKFQVSEATESDFLVGLCIPDITLIDGLASDGIYFRKIDGTAVCNFVLEHATVETETAALTVAASTDYVLEFVWNGTSLNFYVDGVMGTAPVLTNIPHALYLTPSIAFQNGAVGAKVMVVDWMRVFQTPLTGG